MNPNPNTDNSGHGRMAPYRVTANGLELCVEERGDPSGEPLLLIMGLAAQMTVWPDALLDQYVEAGFRVIRYDNRDIGLSSEINAPLRGKPLVAMGRYKLGLKVLAPYTLMDHAQDAVGLMDALGLDSAHIVGVSMGGMIGQLLAARFPDRVRSLTLIMSSTNSPKLPTPHPRVVWALQGGSVRGNDEDSAVARSMNLWRLIQSPDYPKDMAELEASIRSNYRRSYRPRGIMRQMRGILATGDLTPVSREIRVPTAVVHGTADPLVRPAAAHQLSELIPEAGLNWVQGMGHDLPAPLLDELAGYTIDVAGRA